MEFQQATLSILNMFKRHLRKISFFIATVSLNMYAGYFDED